MKFGLTCALSFVVANGCMLGADAPEPSRYTGPGSCSSPTCHGGVQAREVTPVLQNEYSTWVVRDKHAHAFINVTNAVGLPRAGRTFLMTSLRLILSFGNPDPGMNRR